MKECTICKQNKNLTEFGKDKNMADGHINQCKLCIKERYESNKVARLAQMKAYYSSNKDTIIEQHRGYVKKNSEKVKEYQKEYRKTNLPNLNKQANIRWRRRRALKQSVNESYSIADEQYTLDLFNRSCAYCGTSEKLCIDHHKPLSKGHALSRTNAVVLCNSCNCQKNNKMPEEFYPLDILKEIDSKLSPNPRKG